MNVQENAMNNTIPAPSVLRKNDDNKIESPIEYGNRSIQENVCISVSMMKECKIVDGVCCNGCIVKNIQISSKKRTQNKKTKLWYDRTVKITKPICVRKKPGSRTGSGMMGSELGKEGDLRLDQI